LMDMFFNEAPVTAKRRVHFNGFMVDVHARIHTERQRSGSGDPISTIAKMLAEEARLLCFDEFQVSDVADAMILGRLFDRLFAEGVTIVATSNTPPDRLYEGGLNRQLFLPFVEEIKQRLDVVELNGPIDYRLQRISKLNMYMMPLGPDADKAMHNAWQFVTHGAKARTMSLTVLGRQVLVPQAYGRVARFSFADLCERPLAAPDYLEIAREFETILIDRIPMLTPEMRNEARRFTLLIDTLYDEGVKLVCSAAAPPEELYPEGDGADAFRRTASRLAEMQSEDYLKRGHGVHGLTQ
jgi:cell division protein ZapE